jgi:hypothetical protein
MEPSQQSTQESASGESTEIPIHLSKYTKALLAGWKHAEKRQAESANKIAVSQTVSFLAFVYEKMRNAVEFREEHLVRRAAIERILKRRMILNENGREVAEPLIKELLWARYYENNTLGEETINELQVIIDKYFFIRNELTAGRPTKEQENINEFILQVLSCEIEENLSPDVKQELFTNYVYQMVRHKIAPFDLDAEIERDIIVYIVVEKTLNHSDEPQIRYHLLKLMVPEITDITWQNADKILPQLYDVYTQIEKYLHYPLLDKTRNIIRKQIPPFLILRDIFEQNPHTVEKILVDETKLKYKVDESCRKRYDQSRRKLRMTGIRSFIYILLTKVVLALLIEVPYDLYIIKKISYIPIAVNVIVPPLLMAIIILTVSVPGDDNTKRIYQMTKDIITSDPDTESKAHSINVGRKKNQSIIFTALFSLVYLATYVVTFGGIITVLSRYDFSPVSQGIFIFFVTLVTFFAFRITQITQEYQVISRDNLLSSIADIFFLPVIKVGQWLSGEVVSRFNILIVIMDFLIEMPFKAIAEVIDEWVHFVKGKKDEIS